MSLARQLEEAVGGPLEEDPTITAVHLANLAHHQAHGGEVSIPQFIAMGLGTTAATLIYLHQREVKALIRRFRRFGEKEVAIFRRFLSSLARKDEEAARGSAYETGRE